jgi:hypothetical protein
MLLGKSRAGKTARRTTIGASSWGIREQWRCSPKVAAPASRPMRQSFSSACRTCGYVGRGNGACVGWRQLWQALQLDRFWADHLPPSRKGRRWDQVPRVLVAPGSEWRLHPTGSAGAPLLTCWVSWENSFSMQLAAPIPTSSTYRGWIITGTTTGTTIAIGTETTIAGTTTIDPDNGRIADTICTRSLLRRPTHRKSEWGPGSI